MNPIVNAEFVFDVFKLAFYIACAYLALYVYARRLQTGWLRRVTDRRFAILALLTLLIVGIKIFEDVIAKESGPADTALLWLVRDNTPAVMVEFFTLVTLSGAGRFLAPTTAVLAAVFFLMQHRREAMLMTTSMLCAWALTYTLKALVDRARPDLWSTAWYWGASFPSGHTLSTAAFATALSLCAARLWPRSRYAAAALAIVWIFLVGLSRLVLGVHWPTDVLAAICLGVFIPLAISLALDLHQYPAAKNW
jgi:undecaprenyl-diphosphatase